MKCYRLGITLVELLVVVAIMSLLMAITIPAIQKIRASSARAGCASKLGQLSLASHNYIAVHQKYPEGCGFPFLRTTHDLLTQTGISWQTALLPHLEHVTLATQILETHRLDPTGADAMHRVHGNTPIPAFRCPSDGRRGGYTTSGLYWELSNYLGVAGTSHWFYDGMMHRHWAVRVSEVTDGTSNTLYLGERPTGPQGMFNAWYSNWGVMHPNQNQFIPIEKKFDWYNVMAVDCPIQKGLFFPGQYDNACDLNHYWSLHPGGANFAFADGSVRFLAYSADPILPALATVAGGEVGVPIP